MISTALRDQTARLVLRMCERRGDQAEFLTDKDDATPVTIYGMPEPVADQEPGGVRQMTFLAPRQTSFPPASIGFGALLRHPASTGLLYEIIGWKSDLGDLADSAVVELACRRPGHSVEAGNDA
jgi:hypothetical protein